MPFARLPGREMMLTATSKTAVAEYLVDVGPHGHCGGRSRSSEVVLQHRELLDSVETLAGIDRVENVPEVLTDGHVGLVVLAVVREVVAELGVGRSGLLVHITHGHMLQARHDDAFELASSQQLK